MRVVVMQPALQSVLERADSHLDVVMTQPENAARALAYEMADALIVDLTKPSSALGAVLLDIVQRHQRVPLMLLTDMSHDCSCRVTELLQAVAPRILITSPADGAGSVQEMLAALPAARLSTELITGLAKPLEQLRESLKRAVTWVLTHPNRYRVKDVAACANLSRRPMEREIRAAGIRSLATILRASWIARAYVLITRLDYSISRAAVSLGFASDRTVRSHLQFLLPGATEESLRSIPAPEFGRLLCAYLLYESPTQSAHASRGMSQLPSRRARPLADR